MIVRDHGTASSRPTSSEEAHADAEVVRNGAQGYIGEDDDLTLDDLFDPQRSAKENKSLLMSYELDRMQMGRYQWFVFFLCGLGYFVSIPEVVQR